MGRSASDQDGAAPRRSRREVLAGGAAGALGAIAIEALASAPQAQAANGGSALPGSPGSTAETTTDVVKVTAGDASITVSGTTARPKIETGTLDEIATLHPAAAALTFNGQKGIEVANGSAATDVAAFGQLPSSSSPLPLTDGGTGQNSQQAAMDALAGTQTAHEYLRGNGTHVVMSPIQAEDVPPLKDYGPKGRTGATAPTRYVGGTASGSPITGTFSTGDFVIDQTGALWICTTSGSPGIWTRIGSGGAANHGGLFGDGSDGTATLNGSTAYDNFSSLDGSTYTLTSDVFCTNLTINSGIIVNPMSFRIFCAGTLINNGQISMNGNDAKGATGGGPTPANSLVVGANGGNGGTGSGQPGGAYGDNLGACVGGPGGNGSKGTGGSAGFGQAVTWRLKMPTVLISGSMFNTNEYTLAPGTGGGGGGGDGTHSGGGGGGGGGMIAIWAHTLINNGTVTATGGDGAKGTGGNSGGGGGGGGGAIIAYTLSPWTKGTMITTGGTAGRGTGTGTAGTAGYPGLAYNVVVL